MREFYIGGIMKRTLLSEMVRTHQAQENCRKRGNDEWFDKHSEHLERLADNLPSGGGFDSGTKIELLSDTKAVFRTSFHHMNDAGYYDGWTEHEIVVTPTFTGLSITVSGRNRNDIKDYIGETLHYLLEEEVNDKGRILSRVEAYKKYQEGIANGTIA